MNTPAVYTSAIVLVASLIITLSPFFGVPLESIELARSVIDGAVGIFSLWFIYEVITSKREGLAKVLWVGALLTFGWLAATAYWLTNVWPTHKVNQLLDSDFDIAPA